ncbi:hypothetical protein MPDQ_000310 [Monascus purpureus]|uniref:Carrier domain-containing protein n=1 Tax=Monascus purpureus TaxID=5098 RepID=A0A507QSE8_MONPU|nr:hypothetical protein MPDQ_000310 [Monascus purpureus]
MNLPGVPRRRITWRIKDHEAFMRDQLVRNMTPGGKVVEPQFYASDDVDPLTVLDDLIFRDKVDVVYGPRVAARRRIEWPAMDMDIRQSLDQDFADPNTLILASTMSYTGLVASLLWCFSFVDRDSDMIFQGKIAEQSSEWDADVDWLATIIARSGADLPKLFDTIRASGFLGEIIPHSLQMFKEMHPMAGISQNPHDREGKLGLNGLPEPMNDIFGFWLPHGLSSDDEIYATQLRRCFQRFNAIERVFQEVKHPSKQIAGSSGFTRASYLKSYCTHSASDIGALGAISSKYGTSLSATWLSLSTLALDKIFTREARFLRIASDKESTLSSLISFRSFMRNPKAALPSIACVAPWPLNGSIGGDTVKAISVTPDSDAIQDTSLIYDLLAIIAAEVGVGPEDMTEDTIFRDLGVESLMAITVLTTIRNELGLDLPPAFFVDYDTVGAAKQALQMQMQCEGRTRIGRE